MKGWLSATSLFISRCFHNSLWGKHRSAVSSAWFFSIQNQSRAKEGVAVTMLVVWQAPAWQPWKWDAEGGTCLTLLSFQPWQAGVVCKRHSLNPFWGRLGLDIFCILPMELATKEVFCGDGGDEALKCERQMARTKSSWAVQGQCWKLIPFSHLGSAFLPVLNPFFLASL